MKKINKYIFCYFLIAIFSFSFTSCDEDWFDDDWWDEGGWHDDRRAESAMGGRWFVDRVYGDLRNCPYYRGDEFIFNSNGRVEVIGDEDFFQSGRWYIEDRNLHIDLGYDSHGYRVYMVAYIHELYRDFTSLEFRDYYQKTEYDLDLVR